MLPGSGLEGFLDFLRLVVGVPAVLVLPGWAWSFALLPRVPLDVPSRLAVASGLSLAIVPFAAIAWSRVLGLPLDAVGACVLVVLVTGAGLGLRRWRDSRVRPAAG